MQDNITELIKNKIDILDIIGERVRLKKSGSSFVGLCPFHHEDTASFHVFTDSQNYHCFGCNKGGDIFTFIMQIEGLDFKQALEFLASRAGIEIEHEKKLTKDLNSYDVLNAASKIFSDNIKNTEGSIAREYLKKRFLDSNDCINFSLGYSSNSWDSLTRILKNSGFSEKQILDSGLAIQNKNGSLYDRFRGRLIFPVKDVTGRIIAFGGRLIDGDGAKYINSPESKIYTKRNNLYLLNEAKKFIRKKSRAILVEGYMDALRLHKCGFKESVASLGTSLTPEQADLLSRFSDRCYICYDSDTAGQEASLRGMYILQEHGLDVRVINLPLDSKDPDEFLCNNDAPKFEELIESAKPLIIQHLESLKQQLETPGQFRNAEKILLENLSRLRIPEIQPFQNKICSVLGLSPNELTSKLENFSKNRNFNIYSSDLNSDLKSEKTFLNSEPDKINLINSMETSICALLWKYPELRANANSDNLFHTLSEYAFNIASAILMYGSEEMNQRWLMTGETDSISFISQGEKFLRTLDSKQQNLTPIEKWHTLNKMLMNLKNDKRFGEIKYKMLHGTASKDEIKEFNNVLTILKVENPK